MQYIKLTSLPEFGFAHIFAIQRYENTLPALPLEEQRLEITYIVQGQLKLMQGKDHFTANPDAVICNPYRDVLQLESSGAHEHHTVCFYVRYDCAQTLTNGQNGFLSIPLVTNAADRTGRIKKLIDEIIQKNTLHSESRIFCSGLFLQLLAEISEANQPNIKSSAYYNPSYVNKAKNYIFEHLDQPILQKEIAEYLHISPEYLCTIFKQTEGVPLMTFINRIKLKKIKLMMERENIKLYQAAALYGFSDPNYVSRLYKQYFNRNITEK